jgi:hypothetical protein
MQDYHNLEIWRMAMDYVVEIYKFTLKPSCRRAFQSGAAVSESWHVNGLQYFGRIRVLHEPGIREISGVYVPIVEGDRDRVGDVFAPISCDLARGRTATDRARQPDREEDSFLDNASGLRVSSWPLPRNPEPITQNH